MKRSARIGMRVSPEDKEKWEKIAASKGMSLSAWISIWMWIAVNSEEKFVDRDE